MNKIIPIIAVLVVASAIGIGVYAKGRPQPLAREDMEFDKMPTNMEADSDKIGETEGLMDNKEYIENQVIAVAESKREAKKIAKQIGGELLFYDNQVAVIQIGMTVEEMMQQLEEDSSLPKVYPNYQNYSN